MLTEPTFHQVSSGHGAETEEPGEWFGRNSPQGTASKVPDYVKAVQEKNTPRLSHGASSA